MKREVQDRDGRKVITNQLAPRSDPRRPGVKEERQERPEYAKREKPDG